ncbi:MAG: alpha-amylase family glycosyl hydrolase [Gemmatimonadaceae bacterium]|nr:alpha-amylase family glycosyl hydrolase [Gemmatimonadaceae bacterium]
MHSFWRQLAAPYLAVLAACGSVTLLAQTPRPPETAPAWLTGTTCYEIFVRSFQDSDGDGIGDLRGLIRRLDYLNDGDPRTTDDLGVRCLWLMPIAESPGYHGYDVQDYYAVERDYGTTADVRELVREARRRGIRVLVDMVINHTSREHPAFQAALRDTTSPYRRWYRFAPTRGPDNRWGGNGWHKSPVRDEWYYGFFWQGMPDLNYEQPDALAEMQRVATYWLTDIGVDGLRLDAVKFLVEDGAQVDDVPGTHRVLTAYGTHVRTVKPDAWTVGEVFDNSASVARYYGSQLDAYFAFEVADSLIAAAARGTAGGVLRSVIDLQGRVPWHRMAPFLRNHDQPRTATALGEDLGKARVAAGLLLTLPGVPFVYYGEELGARGPKPDEDIRTPMPWSTSGPHAGFSTGTPWRPLQRDSLRANVAVQQRDPTSLLALYRRLIRARGASAALAQGALHPLVAEDSALVTYARVHSGDQVLVLVNLGASPTRVSRLRGGDALRAGRYRVRSLADAGGPRTLRVRADGDLSADGGPLELRPFAVQVLQLIPLP